MKMIKEYILALTNLYGQVSPEKVVEIYNSQNDEKITVEEVSPYLNEDLSSSFIYTYENHFVHETVVTFDEFELLKLKKQNKPYYVPEKEELLKYSDMDYYEKPEEYHILLSYIKKNLLPDNHEKAEFLCEDLIIDCIVNFKVQDIGETLTRANVQIKDMRQFKEVFRLIMTLSNNVRIWENNGYTPNEIFEMSEKSSLNPIQENRHEYSEHSAADSKGRIKTGRNDPCPCGSGKKYKNCCLRKKES